MYALMHGQACLDESALPMTASAELRRGLGSAGTP